MVTQFGMSSKLGNVDLSSNHNRLSSETKALIESEVRRTIEEGRQRATALLTSKRKELDLLAKALVDYETLDREEAFKVVRGEQLSRQRVANVPMKLPEGPREGSSVPAELPPIPGSQPEGVESVEGRPPPPGAVA
jgi:ATP-dependent metalloprotease